MGKTHLITALAIDCDPLSCATHELPHPHVPVVKYEMGEREDTLALICRYVHLNARLPCQDGSKANRRPHPARLREHAATFFTVVQRLRAKYRKVAWFAENVVSKKQRGVFVCENICCDRVRVGINNYPRIGGRSDSRRFVVVGIPSHIEGGRSSHVRGGWYGHPCRPVKHVRGRHQQAGR